MMDIENSSAFALLRTLCGIPSYHGRNTKEEYVDERAMAEFVVAYLLDIPWLSGQVEAITVNRINGIYNVFASDCRPEDMKLLIAGHIDTVRPSLGWKQELDSVVGSKYFNLGAIDAKSGLAAALDAIKKAGPTQGVGYLFYGDEEYDFKGIDAFLKTHPEIKPKSALSLCGGHGKALVGCRGCLEMQIEIKGVAGHASNSDNGVNAILELAYVIAGLESHISDMGIGDSTTFAAFVPSSLNVGGIVGGSFDDRDGISGRPKVSYTPNKIADSAWCVIDIRPGEPAVTQEMVTKWVIEQVEFSNAGRTSGHKIHAVITTNFDRKPYYSGVAALQPLLNVFRSVHNSAVEDTGRFGYLDLAELAAQRGTALLCLTPAGGNQHKPDEYVDLASFAAYCDACVALLKRYNPK